MNNATALIYGLNQEIVDLWKHIGILSCKHTNSSAVNQLLKEMSAHKRRVHQLVMRHSIPCYRARVGAHGHKVWLLVPLVHYENLPLFKAT